MNWGILVLGIVVNGVWIYFMRSVYSRDLDEYIKSKQKEYRVNLTYRMALKDSGRRMVFLKTVLVTVLVSVSLWGVIHVLAYGGNNTDVLIFYGVCCGIGAITMFVLSTIDGTFSRFVEELSSFRPTWLHW